MDVSRITGAPVKVAVTDLFALMMMQPLASSWSPDHAANDQPVAGTAARQTVAPAVYAPPVAAGVAAIVPPTCGMAFSVRMNDVGDAIPFPPTLTENWVGVMAGSE